MIVEIDYNHEDWYLFGEVIPEQCYEVIADFWEDSEEWCHVKIKDGDWQQWILEKHPEWVVG